MKVRKGSFLLLFLFLSGLLAFSGLTAGNPSEKVVFHDDFSSGSIGGKWTLDIAGSGNRFSEEDGAAVFETYGLRLKDYHKEHAFLRSKVITIENWDSITFSGVWKFTDPGTAEMWFRVYDLDSGKYLGMRYISWPSDKIAYDLPDGALSEARKIPKEYKSFKIVLYKDHVEFWESGGLIKNASTKEFGDATHFQLLIGGWDDSPLKSHMYFDEVRVSYEFTPTETRTQSQIETSSPEKTSSTASTGSGKTCGPGLMAILVILAAIRRR
ncbi:CGP-CTERM sorting domain-containing protein [Thermococcus gammatolerans]|uniref:Uncharacterized protein n=1 Tax=Thermococcus gammatolerans (strain DSM 15229 / JCM 11827 / EJ3) TaxID=593117 RepID=C5A1H9_THEGJ|nr:CGP-CTERM sorting domain-containing protein [Thermococcus gammatolerans]ACS34248.1 Hypothetical protein TGAM_1746 [Thermococcus gammatolerans EJ3]